MKILAAYFAICLFSLNAMSQTQNSGLVHLKSVVNAKYNKKGLKTAVYEFEFRVETEGGRTALTNYRTKFEGPNKNFKLLETFSSFEGVKTVVRPDSIKITELQESEVGISDLKQVIIPIGDVKIGSVVSISYEVKTEPHISGHVADVVGMSNDVLAKLETYIVESELPFKYVSLDLENIFTAIKSEKNGKHVLEIKPTMMGYSMQGKGSKPGVVFISTSPDWASINDYYSGKYRIVWNANLPPEFQAIVEKAKLLKTSKEQIEFSAHEISKIIAYSGDWTSKEGKFIPKPFTEVLRTKKGDCKDYSSSLVAVLRKLGFTAYPALTLRRPEFAGAERLKKLAEIPSLNLFNHAIVFAQDSNKREWWIDPTNPLVVADVVSSDILGNFSLVLDGSSKDVRFLPSSNAIANDSEIVQTMKINADNSVEASGKFSFNESSYNQVGQFERIKGLEVVKGLINVILNPRTKMEMQIKKKTDLAIPSYDYNFVAKAVVEEQLGKYRKVNMPHPLFLLFSRMQKDQQNYIGEVGTFKVVTKIENAKTVDTYEADCFARTPWVDSDRFVENKDGSIFITDTIKTKSRIITQKEVQSENFETEIESLLECARSDSVMLSVDPSIKTAGRLEVEKQLGPSIGEMTDADADKLFLLPGPSLSREAAKKLLKYYQLRLAKDPSDLEAAARKARAIMLVGWVESENFLKAFVEDSHAIIEKTYEDSGKKYNRTLIRNKILANLRLKKYQAAAADLKIYSTNETDKFALYIMTGLVADHQKAYLLAEQWIKAAEPFIKTSDNKRLFRSSMREIYEKQAKYEKVMPFYEEDIKSNPKDARGYHNLAIMYYNVNNYDKAIELEKQALGISEFGAAKNTLSNAYFKKAEKWLTANEQKITYPKLEKGQKGMIFRGVAKVEGESHYKHKEFPLYESWLLEAIKVNPGHVPALLMLVKLNTDMIFSAPLEKKADFQNKAKLYLDTLKRINSNAMEVQFLSFNLEGANSHAEKMKLNASERK